MYVYIYVRLSVYCMHWRSEHVKQILGIIDHMLTKHIYKLNIVKHNLDSKTGNNTAHCTVWRKSVVLRHHGRTNGQEIKKNGRPREKGWVQKQDSKHHFHFGSWNVARSCVLQKTASGLSMFNCTRDNSRPKFSGRHLVEKNMLQCFLGCTCRVSFFEYWLTWAVGKLPHWDCGLWHLRLWQF